MPLDKIRSAALLWEGAGRLDCMCLPGQPRSAQSLPPAESFQATRSVEAPALALEADALPMTTAPWVIPADAQAAPPSQGAGRRAAAVAASPPAAAQLSDGWGPHQGRCAEGQLVAAGRLSHGSVVKHQCLPAAQGHCACQRLRSHPGSPAGPQSLCCHCGHRC